MTPTPHAAPIRARELSPLAERGRALYGALVVLGLLGAVALTREQDWLRRRLESVEGGASTRPAGTVPESGKEEKHV